MNLVKRDGQWLNELKMVARPQTYKESCSVMVDIWENTISSFKLLEYWNVQWNLSCRLGKQLTLKNLPAYQKALINRLAQNKFPALLFTQLYNLCGFSSINVCVF